MSESLRVRRMRALEEKLLKLSSGEHKTAAQYRKYVPDERLDTIITVLEVLAECGYLRRFGDYYALSLDGEERLDALFERAYYV